MVYEDDDLAKAINEVRHLHDQCLTLLRENEQLRAAMKLVSQRLYGLSTVVHSNGAIKECAEYLDGKLSEDNSNAMQTFGTLEE